MSLYYCAAAWAIAEVVCFTLQRLDPTQHKDRLPKQQPVYRAALWKDVLLALDQDNATDRFLDTLTGSAVPKRGHVEARLAVHLFGTDLDTVRADSFRHHQLHSAVADLEKRRNRRFPSGHDTGDVAAATTVPMTSRSSGCASTTLAAQLLFCLWNTLGHIALLALGFSSLEAGVMAGGPVSNSQPSIIWLLSSPAYALNSSVIKTLCTLRGEGHRITIIARADARLPEINFSALPGFIVVADALALPMIAGWIESGTRIGGLLAINPPIHGLVEVALACPRDPTYQTPGKDTAFHSLCRDIAQVHVVSTSKSQAHTVLRRYCSLKSIPIHSADQQTSFARCIVDAIAMMGSIQAPIPTVVLETVEREQPVQPTRPRLVQQSSLAMMPSLENISSIGMCVTPPLRTRQRSRSTGTVIGYGHLAGLPLDSKVPVRMGRQTSRSSSWTTPMKV